MPGRYAVEVLQPCFNGPHGIHGAGFRLGALAVIGMAAGVSGTKLFRWEAGRRKGSARWWVAAALTSWVTVGAIAWVTGRLRPVSPEAAAWTSITETQIAEIGFDNLPPAAALPAALAPPTLDSAPSRECARRLAPCPQEKPDEAGQSARTLV